MILHASGLHYYNNRYIKSETGSTSEIPDSTKRKPNKQELTVHIRVHVLSFSSCTRPLDLWLYDERALFPGQVHFMLHRHRVTRAS